MIIISNITLAMNHLAGLENIILARFSKNFNGHSDIAINVGVYHMSI